MCVVHTMKIYLFKPTALREQDSPTNTTNELFFDLIVRNPMGE